MPVEALSLRTGSGQPMATTQDKLGPFEKQFALPAVTIGQRHEGGGQIVPVGDEQEAVTAGFDADQAANWPNQMALSGARNGSGSYSLGRPMTNGTAITGRAGSAQMAA